MARDQRRLAAIVSADVAGYSRLMGVDEGRTLDALKAHRRELIDPKITEYGGRIVKTTGDGLLLEFPSVVEAVRCAVDVQRGLALRNADVPADQKIEFRIGINVGDIIIEDGDNERDTRKTAVPVGQRGSNPKQIIWARPGSGDRARLLFPAISGLAAFATSEMHRHLEIQVGSRMVGSV